MSRYPLRTKNTLRSGNEGQYCWPTLALFGGSLDASLIDTWWLDILCGNLTIPSERLINDLCISVLTGTSGLLFGLLRETTDDLSASIGAHIGHNTLAILHFFNLLPIIPFPNLDPFWSPPR